MIGIIKNIETFHPIHPFNPKNHGSDKCIKDENYIKTGRTGHVPGMCVYTVHI